MSLSPKIRDKAQLLFKDYPKKVHALLPILLLVQEESGQIDDQAMEEVAKLVEVPLTHVQGVVTFYTMYSMDKRPAHYIGVCTNAGCWLRGGPELYKQIAHYISENNLQTKIHLEETECLGACGVAPVVLLGKRYLEYAKLEHIEKWCKKEKLT